jgi:hypothetical protein
LLSFGLQLKKPSQQLFSSMYFGWFWLVFPSLNTSGGFRPLKHLGV